MANSSNSFEAKDTKTPLQKAEPQKKPLPSKNVFRSKTEAYTYAIALLVEINAEYKHPQPHLIDCTQKIIIAIENHEQNVEVVQQYLANIPDGSIPLKYKSRLNQLKLALLYSPYHKQTLEQKYENFLQRRLESDICLELILNPTDAMMDAVKKISTQILEVINSIEAESGYNINLLNQLTHILAPKGNADAFGSLPDLTLKTIKNILKLNDPNTLITIMCIHCIFAKTVMRTVPITTAPQRKPTGHLLTLIKDYLDDEKADPITYFKDHISSLEQKGYTSRKYIIDTLMYDSAYYTDRGRNTHVHLWTNHMGLMLPSQDRTGLGNHASSLWQSDVITRTPDYRARVVLDAIENDTIYVAGASGMCTALLGQMETLGNLESLELKQLYLLATMAYIVAGGLHSIHEILGPAEHFLKLIPGYNAPLPDFNGTALAPAPNFHVFFDLMSRIDPDFSQRHDLAWAKYMAYFNDHYLSAHPEPSIDVSHAISTLFANKSKDEGALCERPIQKLGMG